MLYVFLSIYQYFITGHCYNLLTIMTMTWYMTARADHDRVETLALFSTACT